MEQPSISHSHFIAFYAHKGGVGRTLALANCARALAQRGKRVVVIDFDLDSPELEQLAAFQPDTPTERSTFLRGVSEYLHHSYYQEAPKSLRTYIHRCHPSPYDKGELWLMPAGRSHEPYYQEVINLLNNRANGDTARYEQLAKQLRRQIVDEMRPDYVLIDTRSGFAELNNGMATHLLAGITVLVTNLEPQSLKSIKSLYDSLCQHPFMPSMMLLASPLPITSSAPGTPLQKQLSWLKEQLPKLSQRQPSLIPYQPMLALEKKILVDEAEDPFHLASPYYRLVRKLQELTQDLDLFLERAANCWREGRLDEAEAALSNGLRQNPQQTHLLHQRARLRLDLASRGLRDWDAALEDLNLLSRMRPQDARSWINLGIAFSQANRLHEAVTVHRRATELTPKNAKAWDLLGIALGRSGQYGEAIAAHRKATECDRRDYKVWYNLGVALMESGRQSSAAEAYFKAIDLQPNDAEIWYKLGNALRHIARYNESISAYHKALRLKPNDHRIWDSLGVALGQAHRLKDAIDAHQRAIQIRPGDYNIWHNLGVALSEAKLNDGARDAFTKSRELQAEQLLMRREKQQSA